MSSRTSSSATSRMSLDPMFDVKTTMVLQKFTTLPLESVRNISAQPLTKQSSARLYSSSLRKVLLRVYVPVT